MKTINDNQKRILQMKTFAYLCTSMAKRFKSIFAAFLIYLIGAWPTIVFALPQDGQIVSGSGSITEPTATSMEIQQNTNQMIVNWQSFNIGAAESVNFSQPSSSSIALNRVIGSDPSLLLGKLTANGQVFITNGSGVFFGPGSQVDTHGLIATTMGISDQDFLNQNYNFTQQGSLSSVINEGNISATSYVGLLAPAVENRGTIVTASLGSIELAAGKAATLDFTGDGLIQFKVTEAVSGTVTDKDGNVLEDRVSNTGLLKADGGQIRMSAKDAGDVIRNVVNMEGVIEAKTVAEENGWVILGGGDSGIVNVSGTIDASGDDAGEKGGIVHVLGEYVGLLDNAVVDVSGDAGGGEALIGGDYQGKNADVQNAFRTYVGKDAVVDASAGTTGNAGKVIVWADDVTRFYGSVFATGGSLSGDGGFAEISGKGNLDFHAHQIELGAVNGEFGALLLDPLNITISSAADSNTTGFMVGFGNMMDIEEIFAEDSGLTSNFDLDAGQSFSGVGNGVLIILQAENNITVSSAFNLNTATGNTGVRLTLTAGNNITISAPITFDLDGSLTISANDASGTQTGSGVLTIGAVITAVTGTVSLTNNSSSANIALNSNIITNSGNINISSAVTLGANITLDTGSGAGSISLSSTVDGAFDFSLISGTGNVNIDGAIGGITALAGLDITGSTVISGVGITTNNAQIDFNSAISLDTGTVTISSGTGAGDINFIDTVDGAQDLSINSGAGTVNIDFAIGGGTALAGLDITGATTINSGVGITTNNAQIDFNSAITFTMGGEIVVSISSGAGVGNINFASTVDGGQDLIINAGTGTVNIDGAIGGGTALAGLDITGTTTISGVAITTNNAQIDFNSAITLDTGAVSISSGTGIGDINFDSTVDGGQDLSINAGTGTVNIDGTFGGTMALMALGGLDITGSTVISGVNITTNNGQMDFNGAITLDTGTVNISSDGTLNISVGVFGINFASTVDGAQALTVTAGTGTVTISGAMGATTKLTSTTFTGGDFSINASLATSTGNISLSATNDVILADAGDLTSTSGNIFVTAHNNNGVGVSGALSMAAGTIIDAGSGTIALSSYENLTLGRVVTTNTSNTAVALNSTVGGIVEAGVSGDCDNGSTGGCNVVVASGRLVIDAVTGIGDAGVLAEDGSVTTVGSIRMDTDSIDIDNTTSGNINLFENDITTIIKIAQTGSGADINLSYRDAGGAVLVGDIYATVSGGTKKLVSRPAVSSGSSAEEQEQVDQGTQSTFTDTFTAPAESGC
jgi:filamentous hemagglutinin family protein